MEQSLKEEPEKRLAQKALAYSIVEFLYGKEEAENAKKTSEDIFNGRFNGNMPSIKIEEEKINILDLLVKANITSSKSEAKRLVIQGGIKINEEKILDENYEVLFDKEIVLQKGKKTFIKIIK